MKRLQEQTETDLCEGDTEIRPAQTCEIKDTLPCIWWHLGFVRNWSELKGVCSGILHIPRVMLAGPARRGRARQS